MDVTIAARVVSVYSGEFAEKDRATNVPTGRQVAYHQLWVVQSPDSAPDKISVTPQDAVNLAALDFGTLIHAQVSLGAFGNKMSMKLVAWEALGEPASNGAKVKAATA